MEFFEYIEAILKGLKMRALININKALKCEH